MGRRNFAVCAGLMLVCMLSPPALAVRMLIPCGMPTGVRMTAEGVVVCGMEQVSSAAGAVSPAEGAGLRTGDVLYSVDGQEIDSGEEFAESIADCGGQAVVLRGERDGVTIRATVQPVKSTADGAYHLGLLVRDSMAGIGTITYVDPTDNSYGALGHAVCDCDSGTRLPLRNGSLMPAAVMSVVRGKRGEPGELVGSFRTEQTVGTVEKNTSCGIFGVLQEGCAGKPIPTAQAGQVRTGKAEILTCVNGTRPERYAIRIDRIMGQEGRSMAITVTDKRLKARTGGIVQGMSGSPIIQNGRLVGAVTHVTVNDPTKGYGVFVEEMLAAEKK